MKLLLVEDDPLLGKSLQKGLSEAGHDCQWTTSGKEAVQRATTESFNVIVLDLMLPDVGGLSVLQDLRQAGIHTPVLILTALGSVAERVSGLRAGADDYLVKPFAFAELAARLEALGRRGVGIAKSELHDSSLVIDLRTRRATRDGRDIDLTPTEFRLLEFLMRHANQTVTRRMLCEHLWDADWEGVTNVIEVHINRLRAKVDRNFASPLIHTVRGLGYAYRSE
ncbi:MAG: response regulator transcription factor [Planctomycetaceae bacterium]|nr:response regulator transcription factor [Planctomycetales bacterium]MCB9874523.1 response regulator transcription factor [Planctomycetaceae bacterium]MCB9940866.1 response regulator transcription factor [Planctomycetaceae bacterium]HRX80716.1 response regulator transcription factor [Pirellulaceae bacterium]